jgi:hypothetical protein
MGMLAPTLERAVNHRALKEKFKALSHAVENYQKFDEIVDQSQVTENL